MAMQISKSEWYKRGGFKNSNLFRKQGSNGGWTYWMVLDN